MFKSPYVETTVGYRQRIGVTRYELSRDFAENQTLQKRVPHA